MTIEKRAASASGYLMIPVLLILQVATIAVIGLVPFVLIKILAILATVVVGICWAGFYMVHPNQGKVMRGARSLVPRPAR